MIAINGSEYRQLKSGGWECRFVEGALDGDWHDVSASGCDLLNCLLSEREMCDKWRSSVPKVVGVTYEDSKDGTPCFFGEVLSNYEERLARCATIHDSRRWVRP
ncbi:MAG: hypothetical protein EKK55_16875 [Rhodocyclaceae bacterium]|nr:MAG: hypothetical protein EKK55_16875 [Rhodocyclaceae bacterium]